MAQNESYVYFFQGVITGRIKIGVSSRPKERMKQLQTSEGLFILHVMKGTKKFEKELHRRFARFRCYGEWFEPADEILNFIEQNSDSEIEIY